jgi:phosphoglycolate phosphatase
VLRSKPRDVFFDLDGTLTDPKVGITGCIQYALERLGRPVPSRDELEWCIGPPLLANFEALVGPDEAPRAVVLYRERFGDVGLFENEVYAGIPEVLAEGVDRGARLHVASSKPRVYVDRILERFDLHRYFDAVLGSELDGTRTDKRELLAFALEQVSAAPRDSVMIGDRGVDAIGAFENGLAFVGALYGYGSEAEFAAAGATRWVRRPDDLTDALF